MVLDSSAIVAILFQEEDAAQFSLAIEQSSSRKMSAGTYLETGIVIEKSGRTAGAEDFDRLIEETQIEIVPFNMEQARIAREAYRRYGKGNHRAGLNFGDCFAYALAKVTNEPLLFKGDDFGRTDIVPAA
ncbi:MAG TPA: type II toxin-antitoxin system VapC family toxin [Stellaceae bacterium]